MMSCFSMRLLSVLAATGTGIPVKKTCFVTDTFGLVANGFTLSLEYQQYLVRFDKQYSDDEWESHYNAFEVNYALVHNESQQQTKYVLELNRFADMELHEIKQSHFGIPSGGVNLSRPLGVDIVDVNITFNASVDWVQAGAVTEAKDQGACGSCWAFASTGALEGKYMIATGTLLNLSEQALINGTYGQVNNEGCLGGWMFTAFDFVAEYGLDTEASLPYTSYDGKGDGPDLILTGEEGIPKKVVSGYVWVVQTASALKSAVSLQPVAVAIEIMSMSFILYSSGILAQPDCGTNVNHAVLIVGYNTQDDDPYWLLKNSWGSDWGDAGFMKLAMDSTQPYDTCALAGYAFYPGWNS